MPSRATPRRMNGKTVVENAGAAGIAARRDRGAAAERPQDVRQRRPADRVDRARPALRLERPGALGGALLSRHEPGRAERRGGSPPRTACRSPPRPRSHARRGSPRPCCRRRRVAPGDEDRPVAGSSPRASRATTLIAAVKPAVPIAIASRVVEPGGQRHDPLRRDPLVRGESAVAADPEVVAVGDDGVARPDRRVVARRRRSPARSMPGMSGLIRATLPSADRRQRVLVVDARPVDRHHDLAGRQVGRGEVADTPADVVAVALGDVGGEGRRERAVGHRPVIVGAPGAARNGRSPRRPSAPSSPTTDRAARPLRGGGAPAQWTDVRPRAPARWMDVG